MLSNLTAKELRRDVSVFNQSKTTLVYVRFEANDLHMKTHFPINQSESKSSLGPGTYAAGRYLLSQKSYGANAVKGTFLSGKRD